MNIFNEWSPDDRVSLAPITNTGPPQVEVTSGGIWPPLPRMIAAMGGDDRNAWVDQLANIRALPQTKRGKK